MLCDVNGFRDTFDDYKNDSRIQSKGRKRSKGEQDSVSFLLHRMKGKFNSLWLTQSLVLQGPWGSVAGLEVGR